MGLIERSAADPSASFSEPAAWEKEEKIVRALVAVLIGFTAWLAG